jgi:hypothetical protein
MLARSPWTYVAVGIVLASAIIARVDHASPGFDPYGWLVWGYQTLHLNLNLGGAPSWKPVTFLFIVPYSLAGHYSYWLWIVTAVAFALGGPVVAGRIVFTLVLEHTRERWPAVLGALWAAVGVLAIAGTPGTVNPYTYTHYWLSAQSDPMLVTCFLLAIDLHLHKHPRWALTFLFLCSLGRPETWPFMGLYSIWAWRTIPGMRKLIAVELVLIPLFWFGIPVLSGNQWNIASKLAYDSPRELHGNKITGTLTRFRQLSYWPIEVLALAGLVWAAVRRDWKVVGVAGCVVLWMLVEIAFALHGYPGVSRYMFEPAGAAIVVSGVAFGWLLSEPRRLAPLPRLAGAAGIVLVAVLVGFLVPDISHQVTLERADIVAQKARTQEIATLNQLIERAGGAAHIRACGDPTVDVAWVSILAWYMHMNIGKVGHRPQKMIREPVPVILFTALQNGWVIHIYHLGALAQGNCGLLDRAYFIRDQQHPNGILGHQEV